MQGSFQIDRVASVRSRATNHKTVICGIVYMLRVSLALMLIASALAQTSEAQTATSSLTEEERLEQDFSDLLSTLPN